MIMNFDGCLAYHQVQSWAFFSCSSCQRGIGSSKDARTHTSVDSPGGNKGICIHYVYASMQTVNIYRENYTNLHVQCPVFSILFSFWEHGQDRYVGLQLVLT